MKQRLLFCCLYAILAQCQAALPANPLTASFFREDSSPRRRFERPHLLARLAGATLAKKRPLNPFQDRQERRIERKGETSCLLGHSPEKVIANASSVNNGEYE